MNINNAKDYLPFVQALAEGKTIQMWNESDKTWNDMKCNIGFDCDPELYRIKPETTKWWIIPENTPLYHNKDYHEFGSCYHVEEQKDIYSTNETKTNKMKDFTSTNLAKLMLSLKEGN